MQFRNFDWSDMSPGWRWGEIIGTWHEINVSHPSRLQLASIQVLIFASQPHPAHISPLCRSRKLHLISIQVQSETHPGPIMCILLRFRPASPASMTQESYLTSIHVLSNLHPGPKILLSPSSISCFTSIQVPSQLNAGHSVVLTPTHLSSHPHPCP